MLGKWLAVFAFFSLAVALLAHANFVAEMKRPYYEPLVRVPFSERTYEPLARNPILLPNAEELERMRHEFSERHAPPR